MQIYYVIHIMKLVKILIIIVIRKNLLSVKYVLFLYFYVILIFFEKNQKYSVYIYVSIEWDSEFGVTRLQEVWKSFQRKSLKLLSKDNKKFKKRNLSFQSHDEILFFESEQKKYLNASFFLALAFASLYRDSKNKLGKLFFSFDPVE